ncbi:FTR1 family protein [Nitrococcus mobilis]|uniref:Cytochrome c, class I n=1 Tax=Nitrococcus mobilis Nb-231 TaxID=314278 RepID=A4BPS7_9GAMM|nr:FTR1 family protein [Nitrococcus mobilis]EAR22082.1 cytochrome c, class I [Nitrococcus mobilis Nb-231]
MANSLLRALSALLLLSLLSLSARANQAALVQMVEYIGADYINAVTEGEIVSPAEYAEMSEFAGLLAQGVAALPAADGKQGLVDQTEALQQAVADKAGELRIKELARSIRTTLVNVYGVPVSPKKTPDLAHAAQLYQTQCAACHGAEGRGDGAAGAGLDPAPTNFHEAERYNGRSLLGLYTAITQGVNGTDMAGYSGILSQADRWALAFYVGSKAVTDKVAKEGKTAFNTLPGLKTQLPLSAVVAKAPADVLKEQGPKAYAALGYLRTEPGALFNKNRFIELSANKLTQAEQAYQAGDVATARAAALAAYLDGFEMIERQLAAVDKGLMRAAERRFMAVREAIEHDRGQAKVSDAIAAAQAQLDRASAALDTSGLGPVAAFSASFFILFREGLEALLIVTVLLAFTRKANAATATRQIHLGWLTALAAGGATWYAASNLINLSGATREFTEGLAGILAALILFYVGFWMHNHSQSQKWLGYIKNKVDNALDGGTVWTLALVAFISVYREIFETILFYQALWAQVTEATYLLYGIAAAVIALAIVSTLFFRIGMKLPLSLFFRATSIVLLVLSVILLGKGIAALQEGGTIGAFYLSVPTIDWLGIYPTIQGLAAQLLTVALALFLWWKGNRRLPAT